MDDKELLEMAAKAAGIRLFVYGAAGHEGYQDQDAQKPWNPLTDDGDAFRLALKCDVVYGRHGNSIWARWEFNSKVFRESGEREGIQDLSAAARRAIVRAAAEIGRKMP